MSNETTMVEYVLQGGRIIDGTGKPAFEADLAIKDGVILQIGNLASIQAREVIDVSGKIVAPGFIDVHTHDDYACIEKPDMTPKISQGVTTVIVGNCGLSMAGVVFESEPGEPFNLLGGPGAFGFTRFSQYAQAVDDAVPAVNVAALIGHSTLRLACMQDLSRPANAQEIAGMCEMLREGVQAGAIGMSSGVYYPPAQAADTQELIALARIVGEYGGVYAVHIRDEYDGVAEALEEAFGTARNGGVGLIVSHHKCAGVENWGRSTQTLALIDKAAGKQAIGLDCYPYTAGSSVLNPGLADGRINILINSSEPHPEMAGKYLHEVAAIWGTSQQKAAERLVPGYGCFFQIHEDDMYRILTHESCMIGSDGLPNADTPHPRLWGTFPRVLGHCVRDKQIFPLHVAVAKMTGLSAQRFGLHDRGVLQAGKAADITVFDPDVIEDRATYEDPKQIALGIEEVFVNGVHSWSKGASTLHRAGRFLRRKAA